MNKISRKKLTKQRKKLFFGFRQWGLAARLEHRRIKGKRNK